MERSLWVRMRAGHVLDWNTHPDRPREAIPSLSLLLLPSPTFIPSDTTVSDSSSPTPPPWRTPPNHRSALKRWHNESAMGWFIWAGTNSVSPRSLLPCQVGLKPGNESIDCSTACLENHWEGWSPPTAWCTAWLPCPEPQHCKHAGFHLQSHPAEFNNKGSKALWLHTSADTSHNSGSMLESPRKSSTKRKSSESGSVM